MQTNLPVKICHLKVTKEAKNTTLGSLECEYLLAVIKGSPCPNEVAIRGAPVENLIYSTHLLMTTFPPAFSTSSGTRQAGRTLRLLPSTMHMSAFPACLKALVSSLSGRFSPKLMMESSR